MKRERVKMFHARLGARRFWRAIRSVRWLVAPDGLAGTMRVETSTDGTRWKKVAGVAQAATAAWQELRLKRSVEARYVRVLFTNATGEPRLGGLAEVQIQPAGTGAAQRGGPQADRHRSKSGHAKDKPGHERAKAGKQPKGSKDQKGSKQEKKGAKEQDGRKDQKKGKSRHKREHRGRGS